MLAAHLVGGCLVLRGYPAPGVDVIEFQREASDALLAGRSPYSITFRDISPAGSDFYAAGVSVGGRLQFGFPYPPLSLVLILPFHLLGDFRFAGLLATTITAGLIGCTTRSRQSFAAAALLLLTPMGFFVLWAGWTEPLAVMLLAAVVFASRRTGQVAAGMTIISFGLLLAVKQYLALLLPLGWLLFRRGERRRGMHRAVLVAAAITLPLVVLDLRGFLHSAVALQFRQPYRADALSFLAPLQPWLPLPIAAGLPLLLLVATLLLMLWKSPRSPAGFVLSSTLCLLVFFAFNKQAFCNYYHLVIGGLAVTLAACVAESPVASAANVRRSIDQRK
jgi:hypothetical protein